MAINKSTIGNKPRHIVETPVYCPERQSGPDAECGHRDHCCVAPNLDLHDSFEEAVIAANNIYLSPGEVRCEFYKDSSAQAYHCVMAVGNINTGKGHIILTDTGNDYSYTEQYAYLKNLVDLNSTHMNASLNEMYGILEDYDASIQSMRSDISTFTTSINTRMTTFEANMRYDMTTFQSAIDSSLKEMQAQISSFKLQYDQKLVDLAQEVSMGISSVSTYVNSRIDNVITDVDALDASIVAIDSMVADLSTRVDASVTAVNARIDSLVIVKPSEDASIRQKFYEIDSSLYALGNYVNELDASTNLRVDDIEDTVSDLDASVRSRFSATDTYIEGMEDRLDGKDSSIDERIDALDTRVTSLDSSYLTRLAGIDETIAGVRDDASARCKALQDNIDVLDLKYDNKDVVTNGRIDTLTNTVETLDSSVIRRFKTVETLVSDVASDASEGDKALGRRIDAAVQSIEDVSVSVNARIDGVRGEIETVNSSIESVKSDMTGMNASIASIQERVDGTVGDTSVKGLFSDDVMTLNLCCYTDAGYIKVEDSYDTARVADGTPRNEYKTYVDGDSVTLTAVTNYGYNFVKWLKDSKDLTTNTSIGVTFKSTDIHVIGTQSDGVESDILSKGYTALYKRMNKVTVEIQYTNTPLYMDDKVSVYINGTLDESQYHYFNDNDEVKISAVPMTYHTFEYFMINGTKVTSQSYTARPSEDLRVIAYFKEETHWVYVETNPEIYGNVQSDLGVNCEHARGTQIKLLAVPAANCYFVKWIDGVTRRVYDTNASTTITVGNADMNIVAVFAKN